MDMKGFDPKWQDVPDYIIGITKEIWEDRGLATLHHYYAPDLPMRFPSGVVRRQSGRDRRDPGHPGRVPGPAAPGRGRDLVAATRMTDSCRRIGW